LIFRREPVQWHHQHRRGATYRQHPMEIPMRLKEEQITRLAEKIMADLAKAGLITLKKERGAVLAAVKSAIADDIKGEESLARDAEKLLDQTLSAMGGDAGIDRQKMLRMIKEKLAKERKIVL
jgi:hypothetical protein